MGLEFLDRVRKTSLLAGAAAALIVWARFGPWLAAAFLAGLAWSLVNLQVLRLLVAAAAGAGETQKLRVAALLFVKAPVLYGAGYLLLQWGRLPVAGLLAGFAWPLLVVVLKATGRLILGLDRSKRALGPAERTSKGG